jgi:hypothetical protein
MKKKHSNNIRYLIPTFLIASGENESEEYSLDLPLFLTTFEQRDGMNKVMRELDSDKNKLE